MSDADREQLASRLNAAFTDGKLEQEDYQFRLDQLFASDAPGVSALRNTGLRIVESQSWIKGLLSDRAMR